jgi:hypothetical protein
LQQGGALAELYSYANPDDGDQPQDHAEVMATYEYLLACSKLFEYGFLNTNRKDKIRNVQDSVILNSINEGFAFFHDWSERLLAEGMKISFENKKLKVSP